MKILACKDGTWSVQSHWMGVNSVTCSGELQNIDLSDLKAVVESNTFSITDIDPVQMSEMFAFGFFLLLLAWASIMPIVTTIKTILQFLKG